ncbi:MAG TPA: YhjD/YihY/BrkB family envelope integrity protein, partial [Rhodothermales bacterium]|nr:YhjD/YihY/BrkB family envelope integrity protein [Rhodothermales bacterium]
MPKRLMDVLQFYAKGIWHRLETDDVFVWAAAIAFKMLIAFIPLLIMATGVIGWVVQYILSTSDPYLAINRFLATFLPQYQNREGVQGI